MELDEHAIEWSLFKLALTESGAIDYFDRNLAPEDVGLIINNSGVNQLYIAMCDFYHRTGCDVVDPVSFKSYLALESDIEAALGGRETVDVIVDRILDAPQSTPNAVVGLLHYRANTVRQKEMATEMQELLEKKDKTAADHSRIGVLSASIKTISEERGASPLEKLISASDLAIRAKELWELPDFLPTPFKDLNIALGYSENGGVCKSAITGILAQSGTGKSTMAKVLAKHWADIGKTVIYINYEETDKHWERILMSQVTGVNAYRADLLSDEIKEKATERYMEKMLQWDGKMFVLHDPDTAYFEDLETLLRDIMNKTDLRPDAVIIDTIQSMFMKNGGGKPRWGQYEEMMVRLEKLGKDMGAAMIITAQENTNRMKERREVVLQSDTGGSIAIVQKCSVTIHIVSMAQEDDSMDESLVELQIPKNRITGRAFSGDPPILRYNDDTKSFESIELAAPYDPTTNHAVNLVDEDGLLEI